MDSEKTKIFQAFTSFYLFTYFFKCFFIESTPFNNHILADSSVGPTRTRSAEQRRRKQRMKAKSSGHGGARHSRISPLSDQARTQHLLDIARKISKQRRDDNIDRLRRGEFNCNRTAQQILREAIRSEYKENLSLYCNYNAEEMILDDSNCNKIIIDDNSVVAANESSMSIVGLDNYYSDDDDFFGSEEYHSLMVQIAETIIFDMNTDENQLLIDVLYDGDDSADWALLESELTNDSLVICPFCVKSYLDFKCDLNVATCKCGETIFLHNDDHGFMDAVIIKQLFSNAYAAHEVCCNQGYNRATKNEYKVIRSDNKAYGHCSLCNYYCKIL